MIYPIFAYVGKNKFFVEYFQNTIFIDKNKNCFDSCNTFNSTWYKHIYTTKYTDNIALIIIRFIFKLASTLLELFWIQYAIYNSSIAIPIHNYTPLQLAKILFSISLYDESDAESNSKRVLFNYSKYIRHSFSSQRSVNPSTSCAAENLHIISVIYLQQIYFIFILNKVSVNMVRLISLSVVSALLVAVSAVEFTDCGMLNVHKISICLLYEQHTFLPVLFACSSNRT